MATTRDTLSAALEERDRTALLLAIEDALRDARQRATSDRQAAKIIVTALEHVCRCLESA